MFDPQSISRIVHMARADGIDPAALLAVAQVESVGRPFEDDGSTPRFLFERHKFYQALYRKDKTKLRKAVDAGLAIKARDRRTQYRDMGSSASRMRVLSAACAIDEESAYDACSWGIGQILGMNAESLGYANATDMVRQFSNGVPDQVDAMVRFIRVNNLKNALNTHDWAAFARRYNGPAYLDFRYDTKMAAAYKIWARKLDGMIVPPPAPETEPDIPLPEPDEIEELPPPYIEPKTPGKSITLWTSLLQKLSALGAVAGAWLSDWRVVAILCITIIILAFVIDWERFKKIFREAI